MIGDMKKTSWMGDEMALPLQREDKNNQRAMPKFGEVFLAQIKQYLEDFPKFLICDQTGSKNEELGRDKLGDWGWHM